MEKGEKVRIDSVPSRGRPTVLWPSLRLYFAFEGAVEGFEEDDSLIEQVGVVRD